jgi:acyl-CoA synthetase (AMP-forming)/AMP-acid ligase II
MADRQLTFAVLTPTMLGALQPHDLPGVRRVLSAGAPVPAEVMQRLREVIHPEGEIFTPYGATEALPVASIESRQVLEETAAASRQGAGTCVGSLFDAIRWQVIAIDDGPLETVDQTRPLPRGEIGELMVQGPVVTRRYATRPDQNALHKVRDGDQIWHRMGDVGYLDADNRFWFCGRKAHRVRTPEETLYTIPCEAIFNAHQDVYRTALVGLGAAGAQRPLVVVEPHATARPRDEAGRQRLVAELRSLGKRHRHTESIEAFHIYPGRLPVDIRHNSKIFREQLAAELAEL